MEGAIELHTAQTLKRSIKGTVMFLNFLDSQVWANSVNPDQIAPRGAVWWGSTLFAILSAWFERITLWKIYISQILGLLQ